TLTTWKVTTDKIKGDQECGQLALQILDIMAYFAPDNVPVKESFSHLERDEERLWKAVELLNQYSMISLKEGVSNIHRLVQQIARLEMRGQGREKETLRKALELMEKMEKESLDHAVSAWNHASEYDEIVKEFDKLPGSIIRKLKDAVRYAEAYLFGVKASESLKIVLGPDHPSTLTTRHCMALVLSNQGKYEEALQ